MPPEGATSTNSRKDETGNQALAVDMRGSTGDVPAGLLRLRKRLRRAGIEPYAWVINQSFAAAAPSDPMLRVRAEREVRYIGEVTRELAEYAAIVPWMEGEHSGHAGLQRFVQPQTLK